MYMGCGFVCGVWVQVVGVGGFLASCYYFLFQFFSKFHVSPPFHCIDSSRFPQYFPPILTRPRILTKPPFLIPTELSMWLCRLAMRHSALHIAPLPTHALRGFSTAYEMNDIGPCPRRGQYSLPHAPKLEV
jgi:hypothetical protein